MQGIILEIHILKLVLKLDLWSSSLHKSEMTYGEDNYTKGYDFMKISTLSVLTSLLLLPIMAIEAQDRLIHVCVQQKYGGIMRMVRGGARRLSKR